MSDIVSISNFKNSTSFVYLICLDSIQNIRDLIATNEFGVKIEFELDQMEKIIHQWIKNTKFSIMK